MADQELFGDKGYLSPIISGHENIKESDIDTRTLSVSADTAQIGDIVTQDAETWPAVDLCQAGESPLGMIIKLTDNEDMPTYTTPDTALTDGLRVQVLLFKRSIGATIALKLAAGAVAHVDGDKVVAAAAGEVLKSVSTLALSTGDTYTDAAVNAAVNAEAERLEQGYIGKFRDNFTGDGSDAKVTLVEV